jgi:sRNA-binding carbon storage regulator CsrA
MRVIQIHAAVTVVVVAVDEVVVARKVKAPKEPMEIHRKIHRKIQQKNQKMDLQVSPQMARHTVAVAVAVQQEKMSLQERPLMKMASSLSSKFAKYVSVQLARSAQSAQNAELVTVANAIVLAIVTAVIHVEIIVSRTVVAELSLQMVNS